MGRVGIRTRVRVRVEVRVECEGQGVGGIHGRHIYLPEVIQWSWSVNDGSEGRAVRRDTHHDITRARTVCLQL